MLQGEVTGVQGIEGGQGLVLHLTRQGLGHLVLVPNRGSDTHLVPSGGDQVRWQFDDATVRGDNLFPDMVIPIS